MLHTGPVMNLLRSAVVFTLVSASSGALGACPPLLDQRLTSLEGKPVDLCQYENRPILVVNTASRCGYTPQFEKLETLYRRHQEQGLVVLGFPSNDFRQELETNQAVGDFCRTVYGVGFPMFEKSSVSGEKANPFYRRLAVAAKEAPRWNFHKYLIAPDGKTVHSFTSGVEPDSAEVMKLLGPMLKR